MWDLLDWDSDLPSQPIRIGQIRLGRSHKESRLYFRTTMTRVFRILLGKLAQWDTWVIRTTFRIVPSKGGETSSEDGMAQVRIPSESYPVLPTATSPRRYPNILNNEVSFPLHSEDDPPTRNPNCFGLSLLRLTD